MKFYEEKYFSDVYNEVRESLIKYNSGFSIPEFTGRQLEELDWFYETEMGTEVDVDSVWDALRYDPWCLIEIANGENWKKQEFCRWDDKAGKWHFFTIENVKYDPELDPELV